MKNPPVQAYVTTSMLVLDVVEGLSLSTFHDVVIQPFPRAGQQGPFLGRLYLKLEICDFLAGKQCYIKFEHISVTKNSGLP
jgi:hypothetical protein